MTRDTRVMFAGLIEKKSARAAELWDRVAAKDPARALDILGRLAEFVIPKLARTEHSGLGGAPIPLSTASANISDEDAMKTYMRMVRGD